MKVQNQPQQIICETLSQKYHSKKRAGYSRWPCVQTPVPSKEKKKVKRRNLPEIKKKNALHLHGFEQSALPSGTASDPRGNPDPHDVTLCSK
jgi:hypothetical protein